MTWNGSLLELSVVADLSGNVDLSALRSEVEPLLTPGIAYFIHRNDTVTISLAAEPGQAEKDAVDAAVAAHGALALDRARKEKDVEIDKRTEELITGSGFAHNGSTFSSSANAQSKWHAIQILNMMGQITFPLSISTKDEQSYEIADTTELSTMYGTLVGTGKAAHDSGKALKDAINAATTLAEIEAIVDTR